MQHMAPLMFKIIPMVTFVFFFTFTCAVFFLTLARAQSSLTASPKMVTREEFDRSLNSAYFSNMGTSDINARSAQGSKQYRDTYVKSLIIWPENEPCIQQLFKLARRADALCEDHSVPAIAALPHIPWRFAILQDNVEGGMPHTHSDVVCLPLSFLNHSSMSHSLRTLIHEKIHVLQRLRKDLTDAYVAKAGYKRVIRRGNIQSGILSKVRSNPDVDGYVYSREGNCATVFKLSGKSLADVIAVCAETENPETDSPDIYEHPFEMMAYSLSEIIVPL